LSSAFFFSKGGISKKESWSIKDFIFFVSALFHDIMMKVNDPQ